MRTRVDRLAAIERGIRQRAAATLTDVQAKLTERLERLLKGARSTRRAWRRRRRLPPSAATSPRRWCVSPATSSALRALLASRDPAGKQIEFLLQEIHREVNTIGSKVNDLAVTQLVVEAKGEIERLREQVQNVE